MALTPKKQKELEKLFKEKLTEQYNAGMIAGMKTACHVIAEILLDENTSMKDRMLKTINFCTKTLKPTTPPEDTKETEQEDEVSD